jgi:hypothetical protein
MKNKWIAMILVLSLAMNTAVLAVAGYKYYDRNRRPSTAPLHSPERDYHFYEELGLTPGQLAKMTPMANTFHKSLKSLHFHMERVKCFSCQNRRNAQRDGDDSGRRSKNRDCPCH